MILKKEELKKLEKRLHECGVELVPIEKLKPHEEIVSKEELADLKISLMTEGIKFPIVCDRKTNMILDGHTRYMVFKELGLKRIPVYYVNYFDDKVVLESWRAVKPLTKEDVIKVIECGWVFPCKTTKHMYKTEKGLVHISKIPPKVDVPIDILISNSFD